jgi:hypothetical protein
MGCKSKLSSNFSVRTVVVKTCKYDLRACSFGCCSFLDSLGNVQLCFRYRGNGTLTRKKRAF